jgi:hypothetical protein
MKRVILLLITLALTAFGGWALATSFPSDAQLAQESMNSIASYQPMCDHKAMRPRDTCLRFGKGAKSQSYSEMVEEYNKDHSPEGLRGRYNERRWLGIVLLVLGLGGLALVIRSFVRRRRPTTPDPTTGPGAPAPNMAGPVSP